jgi:hypothetical protein
MATQHKDIYRHSKHDAINIHGPVLADDPNDGGKWVLYCYHLTNGEWLNGGLIQDTNRARLATWRHETRGDGYTEWCPLCQEQEAEIAS